MREREIRQWVSALTKAYGAPRPDQDPTLLRQLHARKDYSNLILQIARSLKLDMRLRVGYVTKGGHQNSSAWIGIPENIPMYGTDSFRKLTITMHVHRDQLEEAPFETTAFVIAHELSHIILASTRHPLKGVEEVVDLESMFFGYRALSLKGREYRATLPLFTLFGYSFYFDSPLTEEKRVQVGYLSHAEIVFAAQLLASS